MESVHHQIVLVLPTSPGRLKLREATSGRLSAKECRSGGAMIGSVPEGLHESSLARSAWNRVEMEPFRRDGMIFISAVCERFLGFMATTITRSDRTRRDGTWKYRVSRHFVPGYLRTVPPGQILRSQCRRLHQCACALILPCGFAFSPRA
jgi:hypothetical protein